MFPAEVQALVRRFMRSTVMCIEVDVQGAPSLTGQRFIGCAERSKF
jgi:hypothetical protein